MRDPMSGMRERIQQRRRELKMEDLCLRLIEAFAPPKLWYYFEPSGLFIIPWEAGVHMSFACSTKGMTVWAVDAVSNFGEALLNLGFKVEEKHVFEEKSYPERVVASISLTVDTKPYGVWPEEPEKFELKFGDIPLGPHCVVETATEQVYQEPTEGGWRSKTTRKVRCVNLATGETVSLSEVT